jgi:hypothetical protein
MRFRTALVVMTLAAAAVACKRSSGGGKSDVVLAKAGSSFSDRAGYELLADATHVYWVDGFKEIRRVAKAGGASEKVASFAVSVGGFALDDARVWTVTEDGVFVVPKSGGKPTALVETKTNCLLECGFAIDETSIWFTDKTSVRRVAKSGGEATVLMGDQRFPAAVAVDASHVYVLTGMPRSILRVRKTGGAVETFVTPEEVNVEPKLVVSGGRLYWATGGAIYAASTQGAPSPVKLASTGRHFRGFAVHGDRVYFTRAPVHDSDTMIRTKDGGVLRVAVDGGEPESVFLGAADPKAVFVDGSGIYWTGVGVVVKTPR